MIFERVIKREINLAIEKEHFTRFRKRPRLGTSIYVGLRVEMVTKVHSNCISILRLKSCPSRRQIYLLSYLSHPKRNRLDRPWGGGVSRCVRSRIAYVCSTIVQALSESACIDQRVTSLSSWSKQGPV